MGVPTRTIWPAGPKAGARTMIGAVVVLAWVALVWMFRAAATFSVLPVSGNQMSSSGMTGMISPVVPEGASIPLPAARASELALPFCWARLPWRVSATAASWLSASWAAAV